MACGILSYIFMISEAFCGKTFSFFNNIETADRGRDIIDNVRCKPPSVIFKIQNYHYRIIVTTTNGSRTTRKERVNTHHAMQPFYFC
jgi:hypothetical protein